MTRPLRIEFEGALYHVTSRGDRKEDIYEDDRDRHVFLAILEDVIGRFNWLCHAYCLMGNHYHLVIETPDANLAKGMRQLNGVYSQASNRRHERVGHLFQGRYKAILVDRNAYMMELSRYVVLNPVRARLVAHPGDWQWSSYRAMTGCKYVPDWLTTRDLLSLFGNSQKEAVERYAKFVEAGIGGPSIWRNLNRQIYLGNDTFVSKALLGETRRSPVNGVPKQQQRLPAPTIDQLESLYPDRNEAIAAAYATGQYSYQTIGLHFGLHYTSVGKIVRNAKRRRR